MPTGSNCDTAVLPPVWAVAMCCGVMTKTLDDYVAQLAPKLEAEIRSALSAAGLVTFARLGVDGKIGVAAPGDVDVIVAALSEHFAKRIVDAAVAGKQSAATAAAGSVSRMATAATPKVMQANAEELAWEDFTSSTFGTERKFDPETGQRIQNVRIVR